MKEKNKQTAISKSTLPTSKLTVIYYALPFAFFLTITLWLYDIKSIFYYIDAFGRTWRDVWQGLLCFFLIYKTFETGNKFLGVILCVRKANREIEWFANIGYGFGIDGVQNVGKSFVLGYIASVLAPERARDLYVNYYADVPFAVQLSEKAKKGDTVPYKVFKSRQDAVRFYDSNDLYPCVYSANNLKINGLKTYTLYREHLTGEQRQPENAINLHDEVALMFPNTQRTTASDEDDEHAINKLNANTSTERQRYGGINLLGEQRFGEVNISLRTTTDIKRHCIMRERLYTSKLLQKLISHYEQKILIKGENTTRKLSKVYKFLKDLERKIGFHCIYYVDELGSEKINLQSTSVKTMLLKSEVKFDYYHRQYIEDYVAIKQKLQQERIIIQKEKKDNAKNEKSNKSKKANKNRRTALVGEKTKSRA